MKRIICRFIFLMLIAGSSASKGQTKTVTLDYFFNHETMKDGTGKILRYHYTWEDETDNGYSKWGDIFIKNSLKIQSLNAAPTAQNLKGTDIYIIVDPDTKKENPNPNYINQQDIQSVEQWVKAGGVLVMMGNDSASVEMKHYNNLAGKFGIRFTDKSRNMVQEDLNVGKIVVTRPNPVFKTAKQFYMKNISILSLKFPAKALVTNNGDLIMAYAKYGRGTVFAVGDPWIYNEYIGDKYIPKEFENTLGATELTTWLVGQLPARN